jgi:ornithine cyclodeaminase/alanine dehydrogenase-like protein (mu-crystallin family)
VSADPSSAVAGAGGGPLRYLSRADLLALEVDIGEVVAAVEAGIAAKGLGRAVMPPKITLHGPTAAFSQVMAASVPDVGGLGVKWVTIFPENQAAGLPPVNGLVVLSDAGNGLPVAVMDGGLVTAWRTGASVAVAVRLLTVPGGRCVGLLGCGVQGRWSVRALAAVLPELRAVRCFDPLPQAMESFAAETAAALPGLEVVACARADEVPAGAGVVVTAITMTDEVRPPLGPGLLEPGALAVALDYDAAWSSAAMAECERFYCDDTATVLATREAGVRLGGIPAEMTGDLGQLAAGLVPGRLGDDERLFCLNLGMAVEDVVTARLVLERAAERGVGTLLEL